MTALATSLVICAILIAGALSGALLRRLLPEHHLDSHAKDIVRLGSALLATIAGLVLGLLINSAKTNFDTQQNEIRELTANVILLDHQLEQYGTESRPVRVLVRGAADAMVDRIWHDAGAKPAPHTTFTATTAGEAAERAVRALAPATASQRLYQSQAIQTLNAILQARLLLFEQTTMHMPVAFLAVLVLWLFILFASFSLFSPLNPTALGAIVVFALSASGAIFLILEMYQPFSGLMQIDSGPLRQALSPLAA
jgi:Protein of unknown function (DUF4239)